MADELAPIITWRTAVARSDLPATRRHVALTLALWMNEMGGSAFPSATTLADATGLSERTIRASLQHLVQARWLDLVERGGVRGQRRRANSYQATIPPGPPTPVTPATPAGVPPSTPATDDTTPATDDNDPCNSCTPVVQELPMNSPPPCAADAPREIAARAILADLRAAVATNLGMTLPPVTTSAHGQLNAACGDILRHATTPDEAEALPDQVPRRVAEFARRFPTATCTPMALAKHWPQLAPKKRPNPAHDDTRAAQRRAAAEAAAGPAPVPSPHHVRAPA